MSYKRILVINLGGIGDVLLSTPALKGLKAGFPDASLTLMVVPRCREIAAGLPYIDKVIIFPLCRGAAPGTIITLCKLRAVRFDLAINMRTLVSAASARRIRFLMNLIGPRVKAGRNTHGRGVFFDVSIPESSSGDKPEMQYDIDIVEALGVEVRDRSIDLRYSREDEERVAVILKEYGLHPGVPLVAVHPGGRPSRRWPLENFARVMDDPAVRARRAFVVTGGSDDQGLARELIRISAPGVRSLAGKLTTGELACLLKRCRLFITNDTGPMHIAAAAGTPMIALFGPGSLSRFDPRNISGKAVVLRTAVACSPCDKVVCADMACLKSIRPAEVVSAALRVLGEEDNG